MSFSCVCTPPLARVQENLQYFFIFCFFSMNECESHPLAVVFWIKIKEFIIRLGNGSYYAAAADLFGIVVEEEFIYKS